MKLRKLLVSVGIVFMSASLLVACADKKAKPREEIKMTQEEKDNLKKEQDKIALYIVNHYEGVRKIEFNYFHKGGFAQSDTIDAIVNDDSNLSGFDLESKDYESFIYNPKSFYLVEKETATKIETLEGIEVIYYKGENK